VNTITDRRNDFSGSLLAY